MIKLYFMEIDEMANTSILQQFLPLVSSEKQTRIGNMRFDVDKKLSIYAEVLIRARACERLSIRNQDIQFAANTFGKPYLLNAPSFHFNISHTRSALVAAVGDSPVGIDIEKINIADPDVAGKVFTADEYAYVFSNNNMKDIRFNEVWTKKESYLKWTGEGWSPDSHKIDVLREPIASQIASMEVSGYVVSICSAIMNNYPEIIQIREADLSENVNN